MGTYLSTPVTEKCQESGESTSTDSNNHYMKWGVVDMQGWRKTMEDSHIAVTDATIPVITSSDKNGDDASPENHHHQNAKIFGVFDGHGGPEVARFCSLYLVSVLQQQPTWKYTASTTTTTTMKNQNNGSVIHDDNDISNNNNNSDTNNDKNKNIGDALITTFHALDRMIDDPNRRDELIRLRGAKPGPGERRHAVSIPPEHFYEEYCGTTTTMTGGGAPNVPTSVTTSNLSAQINSIAEEQPQADNMNSKTNSNDNTVSKVEQENTTSGDCDDTTKDDIQTDTTIPESHCSATESSSGVSTDNGSTLQPDNQLVEGTIATTETTTDDNPKSSPSFDIDNETLITTSTTASEDSAAPSLASSNSTTDSINEISVKENDDTSDTDIADISKNLIDKSDDEDDDDDDCFEDADSDEAVGLEEAVSERENNSDRINDDDENDFFDDVIVEVNEASDPTSQPHPSNSIITIGTASEEQNSTSSNQQVTTEGKLSIIFQRLLNISAGGQNGQVVMQVDNNNAGEGGGSNCNAPQRRGLSPRSSLFASTTPASVIRNGQMFCNLQDHAIHAGATAIVAVIVGDTLSVANAGDSRAVLCRGMTAIPLSADHKPMQEREFSRIRNAGGFVNSFGRVNGNLNLSRSIGDLKYKQVAGVKPENQIITAHPDIRQIQLSSEDEFILLGCDGIWDCLSNESAVEYVRERINMKTLTEIGIEMLNTIISDDPRMTQGIGGDNMTIMIIDLQPRKRQTNNNNALLE